PVLRRHLGLRMHLAGRGRRFAAGRPGRVRNRGQRRHAGTDRRHREFPRRAGSGGHRTPGGRIVLPPQGADESRHGITDTRSSPGARRGFLASGPWLVSSVYTGVRREFAAVTSATPPRRRRSGRARPRLGGRRVVRESPGSLATGRRRSNTSPSTSQAPGPYDPRRLWKAVVARMRVIARPRGKVPARRRGRISQAPATEGEGRNLSTRSTRPPGVAAVTRSDFADRHIGPDAAELTRILEVVGVGSLDELAAAALPASILDEADGPLAALPPAVGEHEALAQLAALAAANTFDTSMIGLGYYDTLTPPVLVRNIIENPAWYTAYTPYQPEISQGRLEALLNFQTMVADLTGMQVANASMLDEATAAAEAMTLLRRAGRSKSARL